MLTVKENIFRLTKHMLEKYSYIWCLHSSKWTDDQKTNTPVV